MTSRIYFGKMNSTLGSVVPLAMFYYDLMFISASQILPSIALKYSRWIKYSGSWHDARIGNTFLGRVRILRLEEGDILILYNAWNGDLGQN